MIGSIARREDGGNDDDPTFYAIVRARYSSRDTLHRTASDFAAALIWVLLY
jgi:hypothetical protein